MPDQNVAARWRSWAPQLLSVLRIVTAFLFIQFGTAKLFALPGPLTHGGGAVPVGSLLWFAGQVDLLQTRDLVAVKQGALKNPAGRTER